MSSSSLNPKVLGDIFVCKLNSRVSQSSNRRFSSRSSWLLAPELSWLTTDEMREPKYLCDAVFASHVFAKLLNKTHGNHDRVMGKCNRFNSMQPPPLLSQRWVGVVEVSDVLIIIEGMLVISSYEIFHVNLSDVQGQICECRSHNLVRGLFTAFCSLILSLIRVPSIDAN